MIEALQPSQLRDLGVPLPPGTLAWGLMKGGRCSTILTACPLGAGDWGSEGFSGKTPTSAEALDLVEAAAKGLTEAGGRVWISFGSMPTFKLAGTLITLESTPLGRGGARPALNAAEGALASQTPVGWRCAPTEIGDEVHFAALVRECQKDSLDFPEIPHVPEHLTLEPYKGYGTDLWRRFVTEGREMGVVVVNAIDPMTAHLNFFGLVPSARGHGRGEPLLRAALALAGERTLTAAVDARNAPALALYKKLDFRETGNKTLMWKKLGE